MEPTASAASAASPALTASPALMDSAAGDSVPG
jgi:hypothetical protein